MLQDKNKAVMLVALLLFGFIQGCQDGNKRAKELLFQKTARTGSLYLSDLPYKQLYVEVDTLEGTEVPKIYIDEIRNFLTQHCSKPDGVKIVQDAPVSFEQDELSVGLMALLCLDGPIDLNENQQPAYLHVFFYDSDAENVISFRRNPHVNIACPTTVFINIDYTRRFHQSMAIHVIKHEIGHILGLCANSSHADGGHCRSNSCLMNKSPDMLSQIATLIQLTMRDSELCADCRNDIIGVKSKSEENNLSFKGPFLFKQKTDYSVASLPYCHTNVPANEIASLEWKELLNKIKNHIRSNYKLIVNIIKTNKGEICIKVEYEQ